MSVAYHLVVHRDAEQVAALLAALDVKDDVVAVTVDARSPARFRRRVREALGAMRRSRAVWVPPRRITWGGYSLTQAYLDGMRALLDADGRWSYLVNLSGHCLPTQPTDALRAHLARHRGANFIECVDLATKEWTRRVAKYYVPVGRSIVSTRIARPLPTWFRPHGGSAWFMLHRPFCEDALTSPLARRITRFLRWSYVSDEICLQSIVANGPFASTVAPRTHRYVEFFPGEKHPRALTSADRPRLEDPDVFFARKFDPAVDADIIEHLRRVRTG